MKISEYRMCLETEPVTYESTIRKIAIDEFFRRIDNGLLEPIECAYTLYLTNAHAADMCENGSNREAFNTFADEMQFIIDILTNYYL